MTQFLKFCQENWPEIRIFPEGGRHVGSDSVLGVLCCRANPVGGFGYRSDSSSPSAETIRLVATFV